MSTNLPISSHSSRNTNIPVHQGFNPPKYRTKQRPGKQVNIIQNCQVNVINQVNIIKNTPRAPAPTTRKITTQPSSRSATNAPGQLFRRSFPIATQKTPHSHIHNPSLHPQKNESVQDLITSLEGKRKPHQKELRSIHPKIARARSFIEAVQILSHQKFSPDNHIYTLLFKKAQSWTQTSLLFQNISYNKKTAHIYNNYINFCAKTGRFTEAKKAFEEAARRGSDDKYTYASYITICGNTDHFTEAKEAFEKAVSKVSVDEHVCANYITACKQACHVEEAKRPLKPSQEIASADKSAISSLIDSIKKVTLSCTNSSFTEEAKRAFTIAVKLGVADRAVYNVYIDFLVKINDLKTATQVFIQGREQGKLPLIEKKEDGRKAIDFHGLSHGAGLIAAQLYISKFFPKESEFLIITGHGYKEAGNYLSFRNELKEEIEKRYSHIKCLTQKNPGVLLIKKK